MEPINCVYVTDFVSKNSSRSIIGTLSLTQLHGENQTDERNEYDRTLKKKTATCANRSRQFLKDRSLPVAGFWVPRMSAHFKDIGFSNNPDLAPSHPLMATGGGVPRAYFVAQIGRFCERSKTT